MRTAANTEANGAVEATRIARTTETTETTVAHVAVDGARYWLTSSLDLSQPWTSAAAVTVHGRQYELTTGSAGLGDDLAAAIGLGAFDEEYRFQDGTLLVGQKRDYHAGTQLIEDRLLAVWRGERYCLATQLYGGSTATLLSALRTLRITEHGDGIAVVPRPSTGSGFAGPAVVVHEVPSLGVLELTTRSAPQAVALPAWHGVATRAGELFTDTLPGGEPYFVVVSRDVWATVLPLAGTNLDAVPAMLDRLELRLSVAG